LPVRTACGIAPGCRFPVFMSMLGNSQ
jgi:hypothetical protein